MDCAEESSGSSIIARGDCPVKLEISGEVFDQMPRLVERFVVIACLLAAGFRRDDQDDTCSFQPAGHRRIGAIALVGRHYIGRDLIQ